MEFPRWPHQPNLAGIVANADAHDITVRSLCQTVIDACPVCPTCDGEPPTADLVPGYFHNCPDCADGKLDVFSALARLAELEAIVAELDSFHQPWRYSPSFVGCSFCPEVDWPCTEHLVLRRALKSRPGETCKQTKQL